MKFANIQSEEPSPSLAVNGDLESINGPGRISALKVDHKKSLQKPNQKSLGISKNQSITNNNNHGPVDTSTSAASNLPLTRQRSSVRATPPQEAQSPALKLNIETKSALQLREFEPKIIPKSILKKAEVDQLAKRPTDIDDGKFKRTKERTIQDIIEKVSTWRKLYNGVIVPSKDSSGTSQLQRWSLEDAAKKVEVSKKSLDDYLLQLRFGKKFGFDFKLNANKKVGVLRLFVKEKKDFIKEQSGSKKKISSKEPLQKQSSKSQNQES